MNKAKLKVLIMALKEVVDELESEIYSDVDAYKNSGAFKDIPRDYDEMYDDDDGYAD
tara:strand:- start:884 stop:1054 length:171 start_codon:yes stop_codon:yes gene_type:complete